MSKLPVIAGLLVAGATVVVLQQWDPPMFIVKHLGATEGNRPAPEEPRLALQVRPIVLAPLDQDPKVVAALQTVGSGVELQKGSDGLVFLFSRARDKLDTIRHGLPTESAVGPATHDGGAPGWRIYALGADVLVSPTDVVAARPLPTIVEVEVSEWSRTRLKDYTTNHPGAWGAILVDGVVAVAAPFRGLAPEGRLQLVAGPPLDPDLTRIAARLGGAPIPIPATAVHAARIAVALAAGFVTMVLFMIFIRR